MPVSREIPGMCPVKFLGNSGNVPDNVLELSWEFSGSSQVIFQKFPEQVFGTATSQGCRIHPLAETTAFPMSSSHHTNLTKRSQLQTPLTSSWPS